MINVGSIHTTKTLWALDKEDMPRQVRITPEFEKLIKSQRGQFGFDEHKPVTIYSDTVDVLFEGVYTHTIDPSRIFTTEKGARQSVKDRRKNDIAKQKAHNAAVQDALKLLVGHDDVQVSDIVALGSDMVKNPYVFLAK